MVVRLFSCAGGRCRPGLPSEASQNRHPRRAHVHLAPPCCHHAGFMPPSCWQVHTTGVSTRRAKTRFVQSRWRTGKLLLGDIAGMAWRQHGCEASGRWAAVGGGMHLSSFDVGRRAPVLKVGRIPCPLLAVVRLKYLCQMHILVRLLLLLYYPHWARMILDRPLSLLKSDQPLT